MSDQITNAEVVIGGKELSSTEQVRELSGLINEAQDERLLRSKGGSAELYMKKDAICITSKGSNGIVVNEYGTTIDGKTHIAQEPSNIRINGFWTLNDELLTTLPSTLYTPIPVLVYSESPTIKNIQSYVKFLKGLG